MRRWTSPHRGCPRRCTSCRFISPPARAAAPHLSSAQLGDASCATAIPVAICRSGCDTSRLRPRSTSVSSRSWARRGRALERVTIDAGIRRLAPWTAQGHHRPPTSRALRSVGLREGTIAPEVVRALLSAARHSSSHRHHLWSPDSRRGAGDTALRKFGSRWNRTTSVVSSLMELESASSASVSSSTAACSRRPRSRWPLPRSIPAARNLHTRTLGCSTSTWSISRRVRLLSSIYKCVGATAFHTACSARSLPRGAVPPRGAPHPLYWPPRALPRLPEGGGAAHRGRLGARAGAVALASYRVTPSDASRWTRHKREVLLSRATTLGLLAPGFRLGGPSPVAGRGGAAPSTGVSRGLALRVTPSDARRRHFAPAGGAVAALLDAGVLDGVSSPWTGRPGWGRLAGVRSDARRGRLVSSPTGQAARAVWIVLPGRLASAISAWLHPSEPLPPNGRLAARRGDLIWVCLATISRAQRAPNRPPPHFGEEDPVRGNARRGRPRADVLDARARAAALAIAAWQGAGRPPYFQYTRDA